MIKKLYTEPKIEIRSYTLPLNHSVFTLSNPEENKNNGLESDDIYDYFG